ncbi:uroporphyrinogen-III C-methyltransferase (plasmid) [Azospirillum baldaniorum]|uniref:uroporphyrinogen-III C-methyltransferase n=1 Tax=Azospirillum baldaniorum TaxID=1064539 RepID=A0A9P1NP55_9PROT|nr:uroporphyrinogen-III C-methyltransferase [Azospirillum baldaniorum]CCD00506.1 uroporphyrin-III C-methyltransferase [Azospirillum baldaniorum]
MPMPSAAMWLDGLVSRSGGQRFNFIVALRAALGSALRPRTTRRVARAIPQAGTRTPHVTLVGAGPGDPDLLTVAAARAISQAEVILYDHLVGPGILALAQPGAELICVGKRSGQHSHSQEAINTLIAAQARTGRRTVRLKGGDPMIFGRAGEEIEHLERVGISVSVIPGITAALGCASSAGLSLTKRGVSRAVTFVTAHAREGDATEPDWARLADPKGTLAIYMGREAACRVGRGLTAGGLSPDTPVLAVENGCRPDERHHRTTLGAMAEQGVAAGDGPTLLLIGWALEERAAHAGDALGAGGHVGQGFGHD